MPHAKRTHEIFWTSIGPHMPSILQVFGDTFKTGSNGWKGQLCGQFTSGGATPPSLYVTSVYNPIWIPKGCNACHIGGTPPAGLNIADTNKPLSDPASTFPQLLERQPVAKHAARQGERSGQQLSVAQDQGHTGRGRRKRRADAAELLRRVVPQRSRERCSRRVRSMPARHRREVTKTAGRAWPLIAHAGGKQAKVVVDLAKIVAGKDAEMKERYGV